MVISHEKVAVAFLSNQALKLCLKYKLVSHNENGIDPFGSQFHVWYISLSHFFVHPYFSFWTRRNALFLNEYKFF